MDRLRHLDIVAHPNPGRLGDPGDDLLPRARDQSLRAPTDLHMTVLGRFVAFPEFVVDKQAVLIERRHHRHISLLIEIGILGLFPLQVPKIREPPAAHRKKNHQGLYKHARIVPPVAPRGRQMRCYPLSDSHPVNIFMKREKSSLARQRFVCPIDCWAVSIGGS